MDKKFKIILSVSVLLNLLFIGIVGGHFYQRWASHPWHQVKAELSPQARNTAGREFQEAFRDIKPLKDDARKKRAEIVKILSADAFDADAFDAATSEMLEIRGEMHALKIGAMRNAASQLSVEDRRKMAEQMAKRIGGGMERKVKRERRVRAQKPERKPAQ